MATAFFFFSPLFLYCRSNYSLKATLEWYDMIMFGIGAMVGAGIFVATGSVSCLEETINLLCAHLIPSYIDERLTDVIVTKMPEPSWALVSS